MAMEGRTENAVKRLVELIFLLARTFYDKLRPFSVLVMYKMDHE